MSVGSNPDGFIIKALLPAGFATCLAHRSLHGTHNTGWGKPAMLHRRNFAITMDSRLR
jgi:hypothetical protein